MPGLWRPRRPTIGSNKLVLKQIEPTDGPAGLYGPMDRTLRRAPTRVLGWATGLLLVVNCTGQITDEMDQEGAASPRQGAGAVRSVMREGEAKRGVGSGAPGNSSMSPAAGGATAVATPGAGTTGIPLNCTQPLPLRASLQPLSAWQYQGLITDALKPDLVLSNRFPRAVKGAAPYTTWIESTVTTETTVGGIADNADNIADAITDTLPLCSGATEVACTRTALAEFSEKLLRRPPTTQDLDRLMAAYGALRPDLAPREAMALGLAVLLQDARTLYVIDQVPGATMGPWRTLNDTEIAERMALVFRGGLPDDVLLVAAKSGQLASGVGRTTQAARLLNTPRGVQAAAHFIVEWLQTDGFVAEQFSPTIQTALQAELVRLVGAALQEENGFSALLTSSRGFVNAALETFYGLPVGTKNADGWRQVDLLAGRVGVLTHPILMAHTAHALTPSVVLRGKFVREALLCGQLTAPPPGATDMQPMLAANATVRQAAQARMNTPACSPCHRLMDPIGYGFLGIDGMGRPRADDANGEILDGGQISGTFDGVRTLGMRLGSSDEVARCFARHWFRYAFGRLEDPDASKPLGRSDMCAIERLSRSYITSGRRLDVLFSSLAGLDGFALGRNQVGP